MENLIISGSDLLKLQLVEGRNSFSLENLNEEILEAPINGCFLKHFMQ
jgi:hypothetical protein